MSNWLWLGLLLAVFIAFWAALRRANELFCVAMRGGKLTVVRGRLPPALFNELSDIAVRERLERGELRVVTEAGVPRLSFRGPPHPALEQAARNVLGRYNVSQLRSGRLRTH